MKKKSLSKTQEENKVSQAEQHSDHHESPSIGVQAYSASDFELIAIEKIKPSPWNPQIVDQKKQIEKTLAILTHWGKVPLDMALHVRIVEDQYEILSNPVVYKAAIQAQIIEIPCYVLSLPAYEAYLAMAVYNQRQGWSNLELGRHIYNCVELNVGGRGKTGGRSEYAHTLNLAESTVSALANAGEVYEHLPQTLRLTEGIIRKTTHLTELYKADRDFWKVLVKSLLKNEWTVKETKRQVQEVKEIQDLIPDWWSHGKSLLVYALKKETNLKEFRSVVERVVLMHQQIREETLQASSSGEENDLLPIQFFESQIQAFDEGSRPPQSEKIRQRVWEKYPDLKKEKSPEEEKPTLPTHQNKTDSTHDQDNTEKENPNNDVNSGQQNDASSPTTAKGDKDQNSFKGEVSSAQPRSLYKERSEKEEEAKTPGENHIAESTPPEISATPTEAQDSDPITEEAKVQSDPEQQDSEMAAADSATSTTTTPTEPTKEEETETPKQEGVESLEKKETAQTLFDSLKNELLDLLKTTVDRVEVESFPNVSVLMDILAHHMRECEKMKEKILAAKKEA